MTRAKGGSLRRRLLDRGRLVFGKPDVHAAGPPWEVVPPLCRFAHLSTRLCLFALTDPAGSVLLPPSRWAQTAAPQGQKCAPHTNWLRRPSARKGTTGAVADCPQGSDGRSPQSALTFRRRATKPPRPTGRRRRGFGPQGRELAGTLGLPDERLGALLGLRVEEQVTLPTIDVKGR